jgi:MscS family membrane protein
MMNTLVDRALQVAALALLFVSAAAAQAPSGGDASEAPGAGPAALAADSPRASLAAYLEECRAGRFEEAARYLSVSGPESSRGPELARRLKAVLDRHLWVDLDEASPLSGGHADDGLPPATDEIGTVPGPQGRPEPVRMIRVASGEQARWVFSHGAVARIDEWYAGLGDRWIREHLPEPLLRPGPRELLFWQWLALPLLFGAAWSAGRLLAWATRSLLGRIVGRTRTTWDDALLVRLGDPLVLAWTLGVAYLLLPWLGLSPPARGFLHATLNAGVVVTFFWLLWRSVDVAGGALTASRWGSQSAAARSVLSISVRMGKVVVLSMGLVAGLAQLGYPVASLLAGLGLGGLALALAAQKTVENLFGSISLAVDQPFRIGDFVRIEDFVGTVEAIGLRSTRFRTLDRTLISIPNGRLADMRLESYTARDRMRLACTIGLVYGASAAQMRDVLAGLERVLREHPRIWPDAVVVRFKEFAASSLDIEVMAWFQTPDWSEFQLIRQEVLLRFMEVVERAGTSFAFPTRTLHVVGGSGPVAHGEGDARPG